MTKRASSIRRPSPSGGPWIALAAALAVAACCGGAPTHECTLLPVHPEAGAMDQSEEAPPGAVACGQQTCPPGRVCCVTSKSATCTDPTATCPGILAACDGAEDCEPSLVCCVIPAFGQSSCRLSRACAGAGVFQDGTALLCHRDADCPIDRRSCTPVQVESGQFKVCM